MTVKPTPSPHPLTSEATPCHPDMVTQRQLGDPEGTGAQERESHKDDSRPIPGLF